MPVAPVRGRLLFLSHACYLDDSLGEVAAGRAILEALTPQDFACEGLCGPVLAIDHDVDLVRWLTERNAGREAVGGELVTRDAQGVVLGTARYLRLDAGDVPITVHHGPSTRPHELEDAEREEFLRLFDAIVTRARPDLLLTLGDSRLIRDVLGRARGQGIATTFLASGFTHRDPAHFTAVDAVVVPTRFAATYYREALGLRCQVLLPPVDLERLRAERAGPGYVTFIDPTPEHGAYAFARIADELGRRRPDIPVLVVEGRGTEATLTECGLDLRAHGTVNLMSRPADLRKYWEVTRVCLMPALGWGDQSTTAVGAMVNGVPVVASDRGGLPETLGGTGVVLSLPGRLTPATRLPPTAEEVAPWVEAILRLWDDREFAAEHRRKALAESRRWDPEALGPRYARFFADLLTRRVPPERPSSEMSGSREGVGAVAGPAPGRARSVVLVPHLNGVEGECEQGLRQLEQAGVKVVRRGGSSAIDVARNAMLSDALHDGFESMMFIDADLGFDPLDVLRLLARPEPVVCGVYAKKGERALANHFADGVVEVLFGPDAPGLYPVQFAATGFLRIKATVLRKLIEELKLPLCNTKWGRGIWPFFLPLIVLHDGDKLHYLGEDWAFSHRLGQIGVMPLADSSVRLWHWGRYGFGWEDAGAGVARYRSYHYRLGGR